MRDKNFKYPKEHTIHGIPVRQRLRFTWQSYADFACIATDLLEDISRVIIWSITGMYAIWHVVANLVWSRQLASKVSLTTVLWGLLVYACLSMLPRRYWLAQIVWHGGLVLIITLAVVLYQQPEISLLLILLPLTAVVTMGWPGGLVMEGAILILSVYLSRALAFTGLALPESFGILTVVGGAIAGILGWTSTYPLYMLTQQVLSSFTQAQRNMEDAREHRAHLANMLKNMDQAYYELQRSNAALVAARQEAEQAERFKAEFVTNVSHELRTPLNLIVGFSEVMMTSPESYNGIPLSGPYRSDLNAIYRSAQHLLALVDDVLDLARLQVGKMSLAREEVDIAMLVTDATNTVQSYITTKGLDLRTTIEDDLPLLWIDRLRIRQVLLNLLVNAARFTYQGYIGVEVHRQGDEVVLRITDTGQGISEQDLPKIFEEFRSTDQPLSTWHSGTGLGLPISKKFIELHRGRMGVESTYQIGTTFWFSLPCTPPPTNEQQSGPAGRWKPIVRLGDSERILVVVHEDKSIATLSKRYLEGYQVIAVTTIEEGIALAEKTKAIALLIGNMDVPAVDYGNLVVIHCPLPNRFQTAAVLGAQDLLVKPVSRHELLTAIQRLGKPIQRVLLVDDDPQVAQLFRRMLTTTALIEDYIEAYNGAEALSLMRSEKPDLVLLDLMMPGVDGRSVTDQMVEDSSLRDIPVIIVSAKGQDYVNFSVSGSIEIYRPDGFQFSEVMQTIEATLNALTPGWAHLDSMEREPAKVSVVKPASEDSPKPPTSGLNPVH